jgi:hypothetical protein
VSQADPRRTVVIERHDKSVRNSDNTDPGCYPARWRETTSATGTFVVIGAHMQPLHDSSVIYEGFRFPAAHPQSWVLGSRRVQQPGGGDPRAHHLQARWRCTAGDAPDLNGSSGDDLSGVAPGAFPVPDCCRSPDTVPNISCAQAALLVLSMAQRGFGPNGHSCHQAGRGGRPLPARVRVPLDGS